MAREIAVFLDAEGASAALAGQGKVAVFRRAQGAWEPEREKEFALGEARGLRELRQKMNEVLQFLADCRIFVARAASGVPYFELEKAGCSVWEISGRPEDFLEQVWKDEEQEKAAPQQAPAAVPAPEETSPGHYFISIKGIQEENASVTSKQVLQQFLRSGDFKSLVVVCGHVPPWLEIEASRSGLTVETDKLAPHEFKVKIIKK